jgi:L-idonate 5-dehydrogenase
MNNTMLAAVLHGVEDLRVEQLPVPELQAGQVLLRVRRAGVCGTDVHYFQEGKCGNFVVTAPFILGHEVTGEIAALGAGVKRFEIGQRVVVNPSWQCGSCDYCRAGRGNLCRRVRMLGSASTKPPTNGAFCEYLVLAAEQCFPIGAEIDDAIAAMMEPFAVALHAARRAGNLAGRQVLITGGGPIGLLAAIVARTFGATTVALSDPVESRRKMALKIGADAVLNPAAPTFKDDVAQLTGDGFDIMFEASGAPPAVAQASDVLRRGSTLVQIGVFSVPDVAIPVNQWMVREINFVGSFRYGNVFEEGVRLLTAKRVDLRPLVSQVFPIAKAPQSLHAACQREGNVKIQIDMLS